jgi:peptidoglycan/LPS O-acetylase OafA/YrhL
MAILLAVARAIPFGSLDIAPGARTRISTLDGLRGFLAFGVFFHHGAVYHRYILDGQWALPPSAFFTLLGQVGVSVFFMITGYLFWSRMIAERGQPDWASFYIGRIFRIGPLYLIAVGMMLVVVFALTGFEIKEPLSQLSEKVLRWSMLGLLSGPDAVNGYENSGRILADVTWTLRFEWWFYLSLPLAALAARSARLHLFAVVVGLIVSVTILSLEIGSERLIRTTACICLFFQGMCCASLERSGLTLRLHDWVTSALAIAVLSLVFMTFQTAYRAGPVLLLGIVFYLIISGSSIFGLLHARASRRLGDISYGTYLLQGLVLYFVFAIVPIKSFALASPIGHWSIICLCALLLMAVAAITHHFVELRGIRVGKHLALLVGRYFPPKTSPTKNRLQHP